MWFANTHLVINEGVTREGVISAFHFSETRVFDLFSLIRFVDQVDALAIFFCLLFHFIYIVLSVTLSSLFVSLSFFGLTDRIDKIILSLQ